MNQPGTEVRNIILIGFMGCGKSTIGRELKRMLGFRWIDTDAEIELRTQRKIAQIFATEGEEGFRDQESALLQDLLEKQLERTVISTGGGVILRPENRETIRQMGYVVWLKAGAETIYQRTRKNSSRPILQTANPRQVIADLLEFRTPLYRECAHLIIDVAGLTRTEIAAGIVESARYYFTRQ